VERAPDVAPTPRLPNLLIIGVSKAGTTSLFNYLAQHPDICPSDVKELRYFSPLQYGGRLEPVDSYSAHFRCDPKQPYAMEATSGYFYGGEAIARGISDTCPEARVLVSLREPIDRCWSFFQFVKSRTRIPKDMSFGAYLDRCEELQRAGVDGDLENKHFWGLGGGRYAQWFDAWAEQFGDRFRIVFFDDVAKDPRGCVAGICEWLALDGDVVDDFQYTVDNKTEQYRNRRLQKVAVKVNHQSERFFRRHQSLKRSLRRTYYGVNRAASHARMSADERARLAAYYEPHNARLSAQLATIGLTLPEGWSPRRLDDQRVTSKGADADPLS
jgi:sulfotransferase family protein